jgi:hypothetical protein
MEHQVKSDSASARGALLFPAEESGWELRSTDSSDAFRSIPSQNLSDTKANVLAIPIRLLSHFIFHYPKGDPQGAEDAAQLQAERLHLTRSGDTAILSLHPLPSLQSARDTGYRVDVLDGDAFAEGCPDARFFIPSPLALPLPNNGIAFWMEHSHLVLAITTQGDLTYYQSLGKVSKTESIALLCRSLFALLNTTGTLPKGELDLRNWAGLSAECCQQLSESVRGTWTSEERPAPRYSFSISSTLVPTTVQDRRRQATQGRKRKRIALAIAALYVLGIGVWITSLGIQQVQINRLRAQISPNAKRVENLQQVAKQWRTLLPAIEPDQYPLIWLGKIHKLIPENQSIQLITFEMKDGIIDLRGRAIGVDLVFQFQRSLMKHPDLQHYHWSLDNPSILANNEAVFRIKGEP